MGDPTCRPGVPSYHCRPCLYLCTFITSREVSQISYLIHKPIFSSRLSPHLFLQNYQNFCKRWERFSLVPMPALPACPTDFPMQFYPLLITCPGHYRNTPLMVLILLITILRLVHYGDSPRLDRVSQWFVRYFTASSR
jgi:hypothetical protein